MSRRRMKHAHDGAEHRDGFIPECLLCRLEAIQEELLAWQEKTGKRHPFKECECSVEQPHD